MGSRGCCSEYSAAEDGGNLGGVWGDRRDVEVLAVGHCLTGESGSAGIEGSESEKKQSKRSNGPSWTCCFMQ